MLIEKKKSYWFWPSITDLPSAISASNQGFVAAVFVAALTGIFAAIAFVSKTSIASVHATAFFDSVLFGIIAWRIKRRSKGFAIAGLVLFIAEKIVQLVDGNSAPTWIFMAVFITAAFISGVRGNFAIPKFSSVQPDAEQQTDA